MKEGPTHFQWALSHRQKGLSCHERAPSHHRMTLLYRFRAPPAAYGIQLSLRIALSTAQDALEGPLDRLRPSFGPFHPGTPCHMGGTALCAPSCVRPCSYENLLCDGFDYNLVIFLLGVVCSFLSSLWQRVIINYVCHNLAVMF